MANFCPACATGVAPTMNVCPQCGTPLPKTGAATATATAAPPPAGGYGSYAPPADIQPPGSLPAGASPAGTPLWGGQPASPRPFAAPNASTAGLLGQQRRQYPRASFGARFVALLLDTFIGVGPMIPGFIIMAVFAGPEYTGGSTGGTAVGLLLVLAAVVWAAWYNFTKDGARGGASIGKRQMGLMVVHLPSNLPCTMGQSAVRSLIPAALNFVPLVGWLIEPIVAVASDDGRRLGDRAADTQVIATADYTA